MIRTMINGFCMALADSVPGVSGGTIALILGFYDKFIGSINQVFYGKKEEKKEGLIYLIKLLLGWALGMILAVLVLTKFQYLCRVVPVPGLHFPLYLYHCKGRIRLYPEKVAIHALCYSGYCHCGGTDLYEFQGSGG